MGKALNAMICHLGSQRKISHGTQARGRLAPLPELAGNGPAGLLPGTPEESGATPISIHFGQQFVGSLLKK